MATAALAGAIELIAELGGGRAEGYPEPADAVPAGFLFHGALSTFEGAGFTKDRKIDTHRWVVAEDVEPSSDQLTAEPPIWLVLRHPARCVM